MPRKKQISDEDLLKIAREIFIEQGPMVSAQVIADRVGISQPALFKRFGTKDEIVIRAMAPAEKLAIIDWINERPNEDQPIEQQTTELLHKIDNMLGEILPRIEVLRESRIPKAKVWWRYNSPPPQRIVDAICQFFDRAKAQGKLTDEFSSEFMARMIFSALMGQRNLSPSERNEGKAQFIEHLQRIVCLSMSREF